MNNRILSKFKGNPQIDDGTAYTVLFAMGFCHLLNDMIQSVIPAMYPLLKDNFGFTFAQIGIITLVFQLTSSVLQPFVGRYADRYPQPYSLSMGMCFTLVGLLVLALASDFGIILLAVALIGCGSSVFHPEASRVACCVDYYSLRAVCCGLVCRCRPVGFNDIGTDRVLV